MDGGFAGRGRWDNQLGCLLQPRRHLPRRWKGRQFAPDHILIEPSGVGKLSDVIRAVQDVGDRPGSFLDATRAKMCENFGEFWCNQVETRGHRALPHGA
ncbi:MAG: hypothetical protein ACLUFK_08740 [Oscillospiraceae bacterium]